MTAPLDRFQEFLVRDHPLQQFFKENAASTAGAMVGLYNMFTGGALQVATGEDGIIRGNRGIEAGRRGFGAGRLLVAEEPEPLADGAQLLRGRFPDLERRVTDLHQVRVVRNDAVAILQRYGYDLPGAKP